MSRKKYRKYSIAESSKSEKLLSVTINGICRLIIVSRVYCIRQVMYYLGQQAIRHLIERLLNTFSAS